MGEAVAGDEMMTDNTLIRLSDHVYWMPPGLPDRPSLCAVVGQTHTLMLDAGASAAHARLFLDALREAGVPAPHYVALTHWHWDHVFGMREVGVPTIAHDLTARQMAVLATYAWDDAALDERVSSGEEIVFCADNLKLEFPSPRQIEVVQPDWVLNGALDVRLGGVNCAIRHVGGDHAADSCVMFIEPDGVLFLSDCLYEDIYAPVWYYTERLFPLLDTVLTFDAQVYVEGHTPLMNRAQFEARCVKMRRAGELVAAYGTDEAVILRAAQAQSGQPPEDDLRGFIKAFIAGRERQVKPA
jgi:glyoxylase-like metal-dependent hydrolase (beta-lactamase superfamily II)